MPDDPIAALEKAADEAREAYHKAQAAEEKAVNARTGARAKLDAAEDALEKARRKKLQEG